MYGSAFETTSPSVCSTSRSTPCVLGCWGPMLTSISSVRTSNSTTRGSFSVDMRDNSSSSATTSVAADAVVVLRWLVIFSQRRADPVLRTEDAAQLGLPDEPGPPQVKPPPLVPVRAAPSAAYAGHFRQLARD